MRRYPSGMDDPKVVTATRQDWNGVRWYRCGFYFSRERKGGGRVYLHREVWKASHGSIPDGYHVHHENEDRSDNRLANLHALPGTEHLSNHMTPERRDAAREHMRENVMPKARAWHSTEAGRLWHAQHGADVWQKQPYRTLVCEICGKDFQTRVSAKRQRFTCSNNCKMTRYRRLNRERMRQYGREYAARKKSSASQPPPAAS